MLSRHRMLAGLVSLACWTGDPGVVQAATPAQVRINGVAFALQLRVFDGEPDHLAQRLDGRWGERLQAPSRNAQAGGGAYGRQLLGRQRGPFHETLTLMPGPRAGSSYAVVAVRDLRRPPSPLPPTPLPLPAGARLLNVVQFGDGPGASALFSAGSDEAPRHALERIAQSARASGWQVTAPPSPSPANGAAFWARRGSRELTVVATPAGPGSRLQLLQAAGRMEQPW